MAGLFIRSETARGERPARAGAIAGGGAAALIEAYREARSARGEPVTPFELFEAISTDAAMCLPAMRIADLQSAHTPETYAYLFTHRSPAADGVFGSCHTLDVPFVWGSCGGEAAKPFVGDGPRIESLSARMQDGWLAFARTGNPSHGGLPAWPPYDAARRATMVLGDTSQVEDAPRSLPV